MGACTSGLESPRSQSPGPDDRRLLGKSEQWSPPPPPPPPPPTQATAPPPPAYRSPSQELVEAAEKGDVEACKDLIAKGAEVDYDDGDPIVRAIKEGNTKVISLLLDHGADVNRIVSGETPLIVLAVAMNQAEALELLLDRRANTFASLVDTGTSALMFAAKKDYKVMMVSLLEHGAFVDQTDHDGNTPLIGAAACGSERGVKLLIEHNANVNARTKKGSAPLHLSLEYPDSVSLLLQVKGIDIEAEDGGGHSALFVAAFGNHNESFRLLLAHGADINHKASYGPTVIEPCASLKRHEMVRLILKHGASQEMRDEAMKYAVELENKELIAILESEM